MHIMKKCYSLLVLTTLFCLTIGVKLPSNFKTCTYKEKNHNECLKVAIPDAMIKMANGIPELGAPPLEPLTIPSVTIKGDVVQTLTNMKIYNFINGKLQDMKSVTTPESFTADMVFFCPEIRIESDYSFKGRYLLLSFDGEGKSVTTFSNITTKCHMSAEAFQKNGKSYYKLKAFTFTIDPEKANFNFENLIKGNERLSIETNKALNENWEQVLADVKPSYQEAMGSVFTAYANNIFARIEIDDLFPK